MEDKAPTTRGSATTSAYLVRKLTGQRPAFALLFLGFFAFDGVGDFEFYLESRGFLVGGEMGGGTLGEGEGWLLDWWDDGRGRGVVEELGVWGFLDFENARCLS